MLYSACPTSTPCPKEFDAILQAVCGTQAVAEYRLLPVRNLPTEFRDLCFLTPVG
jgi:hypothetical protein